MADAKSTKEQASELSDRLAKLEYTLQGVVELLNKSDYEGEPDVMSASATVRLVSEELGRLYEPVLELAIQSEHSDVTAADTEVPESGDELYPWSVRTVLQENQARVFDALAAMKIAKEILIEGPVSVEVQTNCACMLRSGIRTLESVAMIGDPAEMRGAAEKVEADHQREAGARSAEEISHAAAEEVDNG